MRCKIARVGDDTGICGILNRKETLVIKKLLVCLHYVNEYGHI